MELMKTKCNDCGRVNRWHAFKWASDERRQSHNTRNRTTCPDCASTNVTNMEDDETMGPYRALARLLVPQGEAPPPSATSESQGKPSGWMYKPPTHHGPLSWPEPCGGPIDDPDPTPPTPQ